MLSYSGDIGLTRSGTVQEPWLHRGGHPRFGSRPAHADGHRRLFKVRPPAFITMAIVQPASMAIIRPARQQRWRRDSRAGYIARRK